MTHHETLIVVVDHSAEVYAAELVQHFSVSAADWHFFGVGGDLMAAAGVELLEHSRDISVVGIFEVVSSLARLKALQKRILKQCIARRVQNAILVDYPDFNLRLARKLSALGIRVYYYISPTIWAWRAGRIEWIRRHVHHLFLIFPFEEAIYRRAGIDHVSYVGHPLLPKVRASMSQAEFSKYIGKTGEELIAILPGSRLGEVKRHLPIMMQTLQKASLKKLHPVILKADSIPEALLFSILGAQRKQVTIVAQNQGHNLIAASSIALSTCGTATLEIALLGTPFVVVYRVNPLSYLLGRGLIRIDRFSIVNILAGRELVPELIQNQMKADNIAASLEHLLHNRAAREEQIAGFSSLSAQLNPGHRPAEQIVRTILADQGEKNEKGARS